MKVDGWIKMVTYVRATRKQTERQRVLKERVRLLGRGLSDINLETVNRARKYISEAENELKDIEKQIQKQVVRA